MNWKWSIMIVLLLSGSACDREEKFLQTIEEANPDDPSAVYKVRLAASSFVMQNAGSVETRISLIRKLIETQAYTEARYCTEHMQHLEPGLPELHYLEAICLRGENRYGLAADAISRAIRLMPGNQNYLNEKQNIEDEYQTWRKKDSLDRVMAAAVAPDPETLYQRALAFLGLRLFDEALFDADLMLKQDSANYRAYHVRGLTSLYTKEYRRAEKQFEQLAGLARGSASSGEDSALPAYEALQESAGRLAKFYDEMMDTPGEIKPYINMARELTSIGEFQYARQVIGKGLDFNADHPGLLHARALIYLQEGRIEEARSTVLYMEARGISVDPQLRNVLGR